MASRGGAGDVREGRAAEPPKGGRELERAGGLGGPELGGIFGDPNEEVGVGAEDSVEAVGSRLEAQQGLAEEVSDEPRSRMEGLVRDPVDLRCAPPLVEYE